MIDQEKQAVVNAELKALRKHMTLDEYEEYLRVHKGSLEFQEASKVYKAAL